MKVKTVFRFVGVLVLVAAVSNLWFASCASGSSSIGQRGFVKEELPFMAVIRQ